MVNRVGNISTILNYGNLKHKSVQFALNVSGSNKKLPTMSKKADHAVKWIGKNLSSAENRLILGASALLTQPFIEASNKKVDDKTRYYAMCRTIAKIIACTFTGFTIRKLCIKSINAFTKLPNEITDTMKFKKLRSCLLPTIEITKDRLEQHKNTLGTLLALDVMIFTNFFVDAPLTNLLTNLFVKGGRKNE